MTPVRQELQALIHAQGIQDIKFTWNEEWLAKVRAMPAGDGKEAEIDKGLHIVLKAMKSIGSGECPPLNPQQLRVALGEPPLNPPQLRGILGEFEPTRGFSTFLQQITKSPRLATPELRSTTASVTRQQTSRKPI